METFDDWSEDQKVIPLSKKKLLLGILGSMVFVVMGIWMIFLQPGIIIVFFYINSVIRNMYSISAFLTFLQQTRVDYRRYGID